MAGIQFDPKSYSASSVAFLIAASSAVSVVGVLAYRRIRRWYLRSNEKATPVPETAPPSLKATPVPETAPPSLTEEQQKLIELINILSQRILDDEKFWKFPYCFASPGTSDVDKIGEDLMRLPISKKIPILNSISTWGAEQNPTCVLKKLVRETRLKKDEVVAQAFFFKTLLQSVIKEPITRMHQRSLDLCFPLIPT